MARGSAPGERRGGRQAGTPNKATADVKAAARLHGQAAIKTLSRLMTEADSDQAKIAACKEILDRAYGKATQPIEGTENGPAIRAVTEIVLRGVRSDPRD